MLFFSACIHTNHRHVEAIQLKKPQSLQSSFIKQDPISISYFIYDQGTYPLETFFNRLMKGDFQGAVQKISLSYKPSSADNEALRILIKNGYVPVYVQVKNESPDVIEISEKDFFLKAETAQHPAIPARNLPQEFESLHTTAIAANAFNLTVVIGATILVLALMTGGSTGSTNFFPDNFDSSSSSSEPKVFNDTTLITEIDYKDYLLTSRTLLPGEKTQGLIFFKLPTAELFNAWLLQRGNQSSGLIGGTF